MMEPSNFGDSCAWVTPHVGRVYYDTHVETIERHVTMADSSKHTHFRGEFELEAIQ